MSYNHEPQFNPESATVQDVMEYLTMKREWLLYVEGYSDTFPDYSDYYTRFSRMNDWEYWYEKVKKLVSVDLYTHAKELLNKYQMSFYDEVELMTLAAFSLKTNVLLLQRYSIYRAETATLQFENEILDEIYKQFRSNSHYVAFCEDCEEWFLIEQLTAINDRYVCDGCRDENYRYSEYLSEWVHDCDITYAIDRYGNEVLLNNEDIPDDFSYNEDNGRYEHNSYEDHSIIGEYHSNRHGYYLVHSDWSRKNKRFFGVELEVEVKTSHSRHERAKAIRNYVEDNFEDADNPLVFERDGSLDNGFEIISQPMGLDKHKELWAWTNKSTITDGLRSHLTGTCGLHVHVSRDGLTNLQIARAVYFVNHQANRHLIETIARRYNAGYCKAKSKKISTANRAEDRYEMINLQNRKTIEFRIFKGSLKYEAIIAAIEFCHAVLNFAATNSNLHLSTEAFLKFIFEHQNRADTAVLRQYLMERSPGFRKDFERLVKPEMKKLIPKPELILTARNAELVEV